MLYQRRTFTCPASKNTSQMDWDRAFLSPEKFATKYPDQHAIDLIREVAANPEFNAQLAANGQTFDHDLIATL